MKTDVSLTQWQVFVSVFEKGSYTASAEALNRTQSAISYSISKMEAQLGNPLFIPDGRNIRPAPLAEKLIGPAKRLITDAQSMERLATAHQSGWETEITLMADLLFPNDLLMSALKTFAEHQTGTRVILKQGVFSSIPNAVKANQADLGISPYVPSGLIGHTLLAIDMILAATPDFPLLQKQRSLTYEDLIQEVQIVIKDDSQRQAELGWLGGYHRWSVTNMHSAIDAIKAGMGFGWVPIHQVKDELANNQLKQLPIEQVDIYQQSLHLIFSTEQGGKARVLLSQILQQVVSNNSHSE